MLVPLLLAASVSHPRVAVVVIPSPSSQKKTLDGLHPWLIERLADDGITIVSSAGDADHLIRIASNEEGVVVAGSGLSYEVDWGPAAVMRLEVLHRARLIIDTPRQEPVGSTEQPSRTPLAQGTTTPPKTTETEAKPATPSNTDGRKVGVDHPASDQEFRLAFASGARVSHAADPSLDGAFRLGNLRGPGALFRLSMTWSGSGREIRTLDTVLAAGPDVHVRSRRLGFSAALVWGANLHSYWLSVDRGGRSSWYFGAPLTLSLGRWHGIRGFLLVEPGVAGTRRYEHRVENQGVWRRPPWSIRAAIGVSYGWRIL